MDHLQHLIKMIVHKDIVLKLLFLFAPCKKLNLSSLNILACRRSTASLIHKSLKCYIVLISRYLLGVASSTKTTDLQNLSIGF